MKDECADRKGFIGVIVRGWTRAFSRRKEQTSSFILFPRKK